MRPRNYKRDSRAPLFAYRSEPRNLRLDGGITTKRTIGPSVGWKDNHFLAFAPNWNDIANDIDPRLAAQLRKDLGDMQQKRQDEKNAKKAPSVQDVRKRLSAMVVSHEKKYAELQSKNTDYPLLHFGEYTPAKKVDLHPERQNLSNAIANGLFNSQMRSEHRNKAPGRVRR